jgi:hypothetical protein
MKKFIKISYLYGGLWIVIGLFLVAACGTLPGQAKKATVSVTGSGLPKSSMVIKGFGFRRRYVSVKIVITCQEDYSAGHMDFACDRKQGKHS